MKRNKIILRVIVLCITFLYIVLGEKTYSFATSNKINISKAKISSITNQNYSEKYIKPKVKITYKNKSLKKNKDYKISYKSNKKVGKAIIKIKGIGKYTGNIKKTFYIAPKKTKLKSLEVYNGKATLKWSNVKYADGYSIYMAKGENKNYKKIKTINTTKKLMYKKYNLKKYEDYYFKIKAFSMIDNKKIYSTQFSNVKCGGKLLVSKKLTATNSPIDRNINLKIACNRINGIVLKPGQKFTWSKVIGIMTQDQGYKKAIAYSNGNDVLFVGGGVCQVSTTLYQCVKSLGMEVVERHEHGKPVSYIESGEDATVTFGLRDFIFKNTTSNKIKIFATAQGSSTLCQFYKLSN